MRVLHTLQKLCSNKKDFNGGDYSFFDISNFNVITSRKEDLTVIIFVGW
ncbi:hypothetical protein ABH959_003177 [Bacillus sp. RC51]